MPQARDEVLWALVVGVTRDAAQWQALATALEPVLLELARGAARVRGDDPEDLPREVVSRVLSRLFKQDFAALRRLCAVKPRPELGAWLRVLVKRSAIDYVREHPEYRRATGAWVRLATLESNAAVATVASLVAKRRELESYLKTAIDEVQRAVVAHGPGEAQARIARAWVVEPLHVRRVIARGSQFLAVLGHVLDGFSYPEVATRLELSRREVELTVRYIEDLLEARGFARDPG